MTGRMFVCCSCDKHYTGDALACARTVFPSTDIPCDCECHNIPSKTDDWIKDAAAEIALEWDHIDGEAGMAAQVEQDAYAGHARMVEMLTAIIEKHYLEGES